MINFFDVAITGQLEQINKKMDKILNLMQGLPIDHKELKIKKKKEKKKKEKD